MVLGLLGGGSSERPLLCMGGLGNHPRCRWPARASSAAVNRCALGRARVPFPPQMGLPKENADKIIRGFTNQKAIQGLQVGAAPPRTV